MLKVTHAAEWGGLGTRSANEDESVFWRARPPPLTTHGLRLTGTCHMHVPRVGPPCVWAPGWCDRAAAAERARAR